MKTTSAEKLTRSVHYRRLSVADGGEMVFELLSKPAIFYFSEPVIPVATKLRFFCVGSDGIEREWLKLEAKKATVMPWYRWNGNSIKKVVCGVRMGTPDFEGGWMGSTIEQSLLHDALFQFSPLIEMPMSLEAANDAYRSIGEQMKFRLNALYCAVLDRESSKSWGIPDSTIRCSIK